MKRWWNITTQSLAFVLQAIVPSLPLKPEQRMLTHTIVAGLQGIVAIIAHNYNPDGTTVKVAYYPNKKDGGKMGRILG
jgi:hypothetical protein